MIKKLKNIFNQILKILSRPEMSLLPGQLAYFFVLALVPTLTVITFVTGLIAVPLSKLSTYYAIDIPANIHALLEPIKIKSGSISYIIIFLITMYISSNGMNSVIIAANNIYEIKEYNFFKARLKALFMVLIIVILFIFILVIPVFGSFIMQLLPKIIQSEFILGVINLIKYPFLLLILYFFMKTIYMLAPDKKIPSKCATPGAMFCSIGWFVSTYIYIQYLTRFANYNKYYNSLGDVVALMFMIYILAYIFVIGMAINYKKEKTDV